MKKIIFVYPEKASFINLDISILSQNYQVIENTYNWRNKAIIPITLIKQLFFLLSNIKSSDGIVTSFGGYWSFFPSIIGKIYKKPTFIILHGTDCAAFDEIKYGNIRKPILRYFLKVSYKYATHLLPVSQSLIYTENSYFSKDKLIKQGYKHFFPKITTKNTVIHNGIDFQRWVLEEDQSQRKNNRFLTVLSKGQFIRKGGEIIVKAAEKLPQFEFYFIGIDKPDRLDTVPDNVIFIPKTPPEQLLNYYNSSKYYLQLSIFEGFGYALCEAMSCGCIPIVSKANILPDIIGDSGYILDHQDSDLLVELITQISSLENNDHYKKARNRIVENYSIEKRQQKLFDVLEEEIH